MKLDKTGIILLWITIILGILVLFFPPLELQLRSEEPRRALISMEMIFSGDYLKPRIHGWMYYNKPPLFNWILVACMQIFQSFDEWVIRLPGLISHVLLSISIYFFSKKYLAQEIALVASLFYFTSGEILFYGIVIAGQIDLFYSLLVFLQLGFLFSGIKARKNVPILMSYLFLALGILTKGIPSIAFQVLSLIGWVLLNRKDHPLSLIKYHLWGLVLATLMVGTYFFAYFQAGGNAVIYLINLFNEASQKSGLESNTEDILKSLIEFPGAFLKLSLPWILMGLFLINKKIRQSSWQNPFVRFSLIVIAANILLYWVSGVVTTRYIFPFVPFICIILAYTCIEARDHAAMKFFYLFMLFLIIVSTLAFTWFMVTVQNDLIQFRFFKVIFVWFISVTLLIGYRRITGHRIYLSVVFVLFLKLFSQWIFYPDRYVFEHAHSQIAEIPELLSYADGNPIHLLGFPEEHKVDVSLGSWTLVDTTFSEPMPLSYQLPYYIERTQHSIMEFHTRPQSGRYYIVRQADVERFTFDVPIEVLYEFVDDWKRIPLALIRT